MNKTKKILMAASILTLLILPGISLAVTPPTTSDGGLVPCDNVATPCNFTALMSMINGVIHFILFDMAVPLAAIMFIYAGFLMLTAGGEAAGARTRAKDIFLNTLKGLVVAVAAWLIVETVLMILGYHGGSWIGF